MDGRWTRRGVLAMSIGLGLGLQLGRGRVGTGGGGGYSVTPANNYVGSVGDSISVAGGDLAGTVRVTNTSGNVGSFFTHACMLDPGVAGKIAIHGGVSAGSGETISQIYATRWPTMRDALPKRGVVVFMCGSNDLGSISPGGVFSQAALDTRMATYATMVDECIANGQLPLLCAVPPNGNPSNQPAVGPLNLAIQAMAAAKRCPFADCFTPIGNPSTFDFLDASYAVEVGTLAVHPTTLGASLMAPPVRTALDACLPTYGSALLVTAGDDTTGWDWLGGRFAADGNANGRPDGGGQGIVTDVWNAATNTAALSLDNPAAADVDGKWLKMAKTGSDTLTSSSTTSAAGNGPIPTTVNDVYVTAFRFKWDSLTGAAMDRAFSLLLVDSANGANTVFNFTGYGVAASGAARTLAILGRKPPSASTYRWNYSLSARNSGGQGNVYLGQLSVRQVA